MKPKTVVCLVLPKELEGKTAIMLQKRMKSNKPPIEVDYYDIWELPQGGVKIGETLLEAASRELFEESRIQLINHKKSLNKEKHSNQNFVSELRPILVTVDTLNNYIGIGIKICFEGEPSDTIEATSHTWFTELEIQDLIDKKLVFPLNIPIILEYFNNYH